jgi:hypothetical protein
MDREALQHTMSDRKQRILAAMANRKKRVRQLAREHREEVERERGKNSDPKMDSRQAQTPAPAAR